MNMPIKIYILREKTKRVRREVEAGEGEGGEEEKRRQDDRESNKGCSGYRVG